VVEFGSPYSDEELDIPRPVLQEWAKMAYAGLENEHSVHIRLMDYARKKMREFSRTGYSDIQLLTSEGEFVYQLVLFARKYEERHDGRLFYKLFKEGPEYFLLRRH
jgi:hypothetical protein